MKKLVTILALLGIGLLAYSLTLAPYKDEQAFMKQYLAMHSGQSQEYFALRDAQLTLKYPLQDFGIQVLISAILLALLARQGRIRINSFRSRAMAASTAALLPILCVGGYVFDLLQAFDRGEFPHWADSMGIPLMGAPVLLVFLWFWAFANMALMSGKFQSGTPVKSAFQWRKNWWLLLNAVLWLLVAGLTAAYGQYWYAMPAMAWLYFFLSIGASRTTITAGDGNELPSL